MDFYKLEKYISQQNVIGCDYAWQKVFPMTRDMICEGLGAQLVWRSEYEYIIFQKERIWF